MSREPRKPGRCTWRRRIGRPCFLACPRASTRWRSRTIDENGQAQPRPRPFRKSGHATIESIVIKMSIKRGEERERFLATNGWLVTRVGCSRGSPPSQYAMPRKLVCYPPIEEARIQPVREAACPVRRDQRGEHRRGHEPRSPMPKAFFGKITPGLLAAAKKLDLDPDADGESRALCVPRAAHASGDADATCGGCSRTSSRIMSWG